VILGPSEHDRINPYSENEATRGQQAFEYLHDNQEIGYLKGLTLATTRIGWSLEF